MENMLAQSRLNNSVKLLLVSIALFSIPCFSQSAYQGIDDDHTTATKHGLYEIREEARKFVAQENTKNHTNWETLDPNLKIVVPKCVVPLKTKWVPEDRGLSNKSVWVLCAQTLNKNYKKWDVYVPVAAPRVKGK
ncbi:hypothetical protein [Paraherbaspirillum soli]|uniref:Uncharacterized protein n=1 Tax=Paraherbaspirillum soli TaxID=631222 RepID=A0ABW0M9T0_9BURK